MGCGGSKDMNCSPEVMKFMMLVNSKPSMRKFGNNKENLRKIEKLVASPVFGGSALQAVAHKGKKRTKDNSLKQNLVAMETQTIYGGGYYQLLNIRESDQTQNCFDVYMVCEKIEDKDLQTKLKTIHQMSTEITTPKIKLDKIHTKRTIANVESKPVYYDEIAPAIDGYARIIKYTNHSISKYMKRDAFEEEESKYDVGMKISGKGLINMDAENLEILEVSEGRVIDGKKEGYNRVLSAEDGTCEVGFFNEDEPKGKYAKYNLDGTYASQEGLYEGFENCTKQLEIANYKSKILR